LRLFIYVTVHASKYSRKAISLQSLLKGSWEGVGSDGRRECEGMWWGGGGRMGSRSRSMSENETGSKKQCGQGYPERK
jgi:hypothetical protein